MTDLGQKIPTNTWHFMWFGVRPNFGFFMLATAFIAVAALLHQVTPYIFKLIIDALESGNGNQIPFFIALYPLSFFCIEIAYRSAAYCVARVCIGGKEFLYNTLTAYTLNHSRSYFADRMAGTLMGKLSTAVNAFENYIEYMLWNYLDSIITFGSTLIFISLVSPFAGAVLLVIFVILFIVNYLFSTKAQHYSKVSAEAQSKQSGVLVDIIGNASIVRQFGQGMSEWKQIAAVSHVAKKAEYGTRFFGEKILILNSIVITLGFSVMMWFLVQDFTAGSITTGDLVFVLGLLMGMAYQLLFLGAAFQNGSQQFGQLKDAISELLIPHLIVDEVTATDLRVSEAVISCHNVAFAHDTNLVFNNFNLTVAGGQRVGLVGSSGAGKSTFVSLLLREHDVQSGSIAIDNQDISTVTQDSLRTNIAVVPQEPLLFHRTIRENIAYGKPDATDEEIIEVAKKAQAHDFITALPQGYNTLVGERGVKLSGGQKQRVAIARAMLKDAPILILDEATSALDSESEVAIQTALHVLMAGKTVIAIAHRLSTLREMDRIIVLEQGKIIEDGTHDTLKVRGGTYARLWEHQAGGFVGE